MFKGYSTPVITVTKWVNDESDDTFYDLYVDGKLEDRYPDRQSLIKRLDLMYQVTGGINL